MRRIITRGASLGRFPAGLGSIVKIMLAMVLIALSSAANAVTVLLVSHQQTSASGTISTLITDGSHVEGFAASTAVFEWDGATLSSTGIYSATNSIGSSPFSSAVLNDHIVDLSINTTSAATATSYACNEGTFLAGVGANGCGDYTLGGNFLDESITVWTGLAVSQTIGGDDVAGTVGPRTISAYDFNSVTFNGDGLHVGDEVLIGNGQPLGVADLGGEVMTFSLTRTAIDDAASTSPDQSVNIPVLANDILDDGAGENIIALTATVPANGTVGVIGAVPTVRANLLIKYTPTPGFVGSDTFNYTVTDQGGAVTATVTVNGPIAVSDVASVLEGQAVSINVLANDSGSFNAPLQVVVADAPLSGTTVVQNNNTIVYTPTAGGATTDTFTYTVTDANGASSTARVNIIIVLISVHPVAVDDSATTNADTPVTVSIIENDIGFGSPVIVNLFTNPQNGAAVANDPASSNPTITYTPSSGYSGTDMFEYVIDDGAWTDIAKVTIQVILDADNDGVDDSIDNCLGAANSDQIDADGDGYGNWCDADFTNDGVVNFGDLAAFRTNFTSADPVTDLNSDQRVNFADLARFRALFGKPPGPSGLIN